MQRELVHTLCKHEEISRRVITNVIVMLSPNPMVRMNFKKVESARLAARSIGASFSFPFSSERNKITLLSDRPTCGIRPTSSEATFCYLAAIEVSEIHGGGEKCRISTKHLLNSFLLSVNDCFGEFG